MQRSGKVLVLAGLAVLFSGGCATRLPATWFHPPVDHVYMPTGRSSQEAFVGVRVGIPGRYLKNDKAFATSLYGGLGLQTRLMWVTGYAWFGYANYKHDWDFDVTEKINYFIVPHFGFSGGLAPVLGDMIRLQLGVYVGSGFELISWQVGAPDETQSNRTNLLVPDAGIVMGFQIEPARDMIVGLKWALGLNINYLPEDNRMDIRSCEREVAEDDFVDPKEVCPKAGGDFIYGGGIITSFRYKNFEFNFGTQPFLYDRGFNFMVSLAYSLPTGKR